MSVTVIATGFAVDGTSSAPSTETSASEQTGDTAAAPAAAATPDIAQVAEVDDGYFDIMSIFNRK